MSTSSLHLSLIESIYRRAITDFHYEVHLYYCISIPIMITITIRIIRIIIIIVRIIVVVVMPSLSSIERVKNKQIVISDTPLGPSIIITIANFRPFTSEWSHIE